MSTTLAIFKREFFGYFRTPVAYVFLIVFIGATVGITWFLQGFFDNGVATLAPLFGILQWVLLFFVPAVGMRLWAEERRSGTWELLFTLPISRTHTVIGKFLAAWLFVILAILATATLAWTASYLGNPEPGPIWSGYLGAILAAGSYLAIMSFVSSLTRSQIIAFVIGVSVLFFLFVLGWQPFNEMLTAIIAWLGVPQSVAASTAEAISSFSSQTHSRDMIRGLITLSDVFFFLSVIAGALYLNVLALTR